MSRLQNRGIEAIIVHLMDLCRVAEVKLWLSQNDLVLMYHSVETESSGYQYGVDRRCFAQHVDFLAHNFDIVPLERILETPDKESIQRARVALTFDDAYADFYSNVYPLLMRYSIKATVFVPTAFVESGNELLERDAGLTKEHLDWAQMREMAASGLVSFESHSHSHLSSVDHVALLPDDLTHSADLLEERVGRRPHYLAYPYGLYNAETEQIANACGFKRMFSVEEKYVDNEDKSPTVGRFDIYQRNQQLPYFKLTIAGLLSAKVRGQIRRLLYR